MSEKDHSLLLFVQTPYLFKLFSYKKEELNMYKLRVFKQEVDFYIDLKESSGETFIAARPLPGKNNMVEMIFVK